jgi:hypothetical protein
MSGKQRVGDRRDADREDEERGERRLRDEELRHALEVSQDTATLGDEGGHDLEVAPHEHEVGDAPRHLDAAPLRDREPGRLEAGHVVDAVADHRNVVPVGAQRLDHAPFPVGRDAPDHVVLAQEAPELALVLRELRSVDGPLADVDAGVRGDRGDGLRPVAREHLEANALRLEERDRVVGVRPEALRQDDDAEELQPSRRRSIHVRAAEGCVRACKPEHAAAGAHLLVDACGYLAERQELGRPEDVRHATEPERAPAAPRREGRLALRLPRRAMEPLADRAERPVPHPRARRELAEGEREPFLLDPGRRHDVDHAQLRLGQRARLVEANHIHRGQRLQGVELLCQRATARHPHCREGKREAHEQDRALRHERDDRGDGRRHRLAHRRVTLPERVGEQRAERDHHRDEEVEKPVHRTFQR